MSEEQLKQKTARGLLWGGIGSGGMQLLNLLFGIVLSRILTPADYGVVGALTIFSAVAGIFTESGFTLAIVNRKTVTDADYNAVFWFNILIGAGLYILLFFLAVPIAKFYDNPEMIPLARFLFLSFFIGATATAPTAFLFRNLKVKERSRIILISVLVSGSAGIICALNGMRYWGIAVQTVAYSTSTAILSWWTVKWRPTAHISFAPLKGMLHFSVKQMAVSLFTHFNNNFFAMLLGKYYTWQKTGYYTQGNKWTTMGSSTISGMINSVGQPVFRQTIDDPGRLIRVFRKMLRFAAFLGFPAMLGLGIVSHEVILLTIKAKWLPAVPLIQILCVGGAFLPIATLYGNLFNSIGRPGIYMWNTIALGLFQMGTVLITYRFGLNVMLIVYSAINILWLAVWQFFAHRLIGLRLRDVLADILPYLAITVAIMVATWYATESISSPLLSLLAKIAMAGTLYFGAMWISGSVVFKETLNYFLKRNSKN